MLIEEKIAYLLADREFYEPISRYSPRESDFHEPLKRILPDSWNLDHRRFWYHASYPGADVPMQGWKIHLSATPVDAPPLLLTAARILVEAKVTFKFVADRTLLMLLGGKRWQRGSSGKFLTAYPQDTEECGNLLEALRQALKGYRGPYILSDRRYKDSQVVHYRYGGLKSLKRAGVDGKAVLIIDDGEGGYVDDERAPYFRLPEGMEDPFFDLAYTQTDGGEEGTLKGGRYKIESALAFANPGGVYLAHDQESGEQVVIKEARPYTNVSVRGLDAVRLLKKEHRILERVADLEIGPRPLDFFFDWEHAYLVEEYFEDSINLRGYLNGISLTLRTRPDAEYSREFYGKYCSLFRHLAKMLRTLHDRHIVFSDLSFHNVLVLGDEATNLRLIDFEGAYEEGVDVPTHLFTPGFVTEDAVNRGMATQQDDYFALGGLLLAGLFPMNGLLMLDGEAYRPFLDAFQRDLDLPSPIADLIRRLLDRDPSQRPDPGEVIEVLVQDFSPAAPSIGTYEVDSVDLEDLTARILEYIEAVADFSRDDRLYPSDPAVFDTNPVSLGFGACGVAYVMHRLRGTVDDGILDWIRAHRPAKEACSPGLYVGLSGVAWSFLEMGLRSEAEETLALTEDHHLLWRSPDLFYGAAGWGMTQLRFFNATGDETYLDAARRVGEFLLESRQPDEEKPGRCFWESQDGAVPSLAHGVSGVSLFLLYLHLATQEDRWLSLGRQGLEWVADRGIENPEGGLTWIAKESAPTMTPYWRWGSSGIGRVLLRYWHVTGEERYGRSIDFIHRDCNRKYAIFPGYFFGLSGIAELYMDMTRFERWSDLARPAVRRLLAGCMLYCLERDEGVAFPGESLSRISCDFGTGSAGIALVMHRYRQRSGASFMLDELLPDWTVEDRLPAGDAVREVVA